MGYNAGIPAAQGGCLWRLPVAKLTPQNCSEHLIVGFLLQILVQKFPPGCRGSTIWAKESLGEHHCSD